MLCSTYSNLRQGTVLIEALLDHDITSQEFADAAGFLQSEAAQIIATVVGLSLAQTAASRRARAICLRVADWTRSRN